MFKKLLENWFWRQQDKEIKAEDFTTQEEETILSELGENQELLDLLKFYLKRDKSRHFVASDDRSRSIIRGQYIRTSYLLRKINPKKPKSKVVNSKENINTKISGRYAT